MTTENDPRANVREEIRGDWNSLIDKGLIPGAEKIGDPNPPAKEEAKVEETAPPKEETPKTEEVVEKKWSGKYDTPEAQEQGYDNLLKHFEKLSGENRQFREQDALRAGSTSPPSAQTPQIEQAPVATPPAPMDWSNNPAVKKFSESTGSDPSVGAELMQGIYEAAMQSVTEQATKAAQDAVAPIYAQGEADTYMQQNHPDAFKFTPEIAAYMETADPVVQATFRNEVAAKNYAGASKLAWLAYQQDSGLSKQKQMKAEAGEGAEQQQTQKADAGITGTSPGTTPHTARKEDDGPSQSQILELAAKARTSGDNKDSIAYRDATIGDMLRNDKAFQNMLKQHAHDDGH